MTRKELEAENRILKQAMQRLRREAAGAHGRFGPSWIDSFATQALNDAENARKEAEAALRPATPEERRDRAYSNLM